MLALLTGLGVGAASLALSLNGWEISRLWLYLLGSAMFILVGVQLMINWVLLRVLEELSRREQLIATALPERNNAVTPAKELDGQLALNPQLPRS